MARPLEPECCARYWEKFTEGLTSVIDIVFVEFRAVMKPMLAVELLSLFWT